MTDSLPPFDRAAEVTRLLEADDTWLGRIAVRLREGESIQSIAEDTSSGTGWVYAYQAMINALKTGEVASAPSVAQRNARRIRSWLKQKEMSPELRSALEQQERALTSVAENAGAQEREDRAAVDTTVQVLAEGRPGVYVYSLPHYLRHPVDEASGRTLFKVGFSASDVVRRMADQWRQTSLPEDPIVLRVYPSDDSARVETAFHRMLDAADHSRAAGRHTGREWFLTSLKFLDEIARMLQLPIDEPTPGYGAE